MAVDAPTFCTIMSTSIFASPIGPEDLVGDARPVRHAQHRDLGLVAVERDAGNDRLFHVLVFLESDQRARRRRFGSSKVDSTRSCTLYLPANSTERICSTFDPRLASSSISSKVIRSSRRASRNDARVGRVDAVDVGVDLALVGLERRRERDARRVEPPRPSVVMLPSLVDALKSGDDDDRAVGEVGADLLLVDLHDARLGVTRCR